MYCSLKVRLGTKNCYFLEEPYLVWLMVRGEIAVNTSHQSRQLLISNHNGARQGCWVQRQRDDQIAEHCVEDKN